MAAPDKLTGLTPQQEAFAQGVAIGKSQADAYREAYPKSRNWKADTLYARASELAANGKVIGRVSELRRPAAQACEITVESLTKDLQAARTVAMADKQASAAVAASMGIAKLHGLLVEDRKNARDPFEGWGTKEMADALGQVRAAIDKASSRHGKYADPVRRRANILSA